MSVYSPLKAYLQAVVKAGQISETQALYIMNLVEQISKEVLDEVKRAIDGDEEEKS